MNFLEKIINKSLKKGKPKIAFGLIKKDPVIINSLKKNKKYADIIIVGPKSLGKIPGFSCLLSAAPEKDIADLLVHRRVDGIVRGTIDDFKTYEAYEALVGKDNMDPRRELFFLEDAKGRQFFLSEASNPEGWTTDSKIRSVDAIINFTKKIGGFKPKIGVLTGVRHETYQRRKEETLGVVGLLNETYKQAEEVKDHFQQKGYWIKNYAIELSTAIEEGCNIIVPPCGMVGNQIYRALCLIGGGRMLMCSMINAVHAYEDNSRNEKDYSYHIKWVVAWANSLKK